MAPGEQTNHIVTVEQFDNFELRLTEWRERSGAHHCHRRQHPHQVAGPGWGPS